MSNIEKRTLREELSNPAIGSNAHLRKLALALLDELEESERLRLKFQEANCELCQKLEAAEKLIAELASLEAEPVARLLSGGGAKNHVSFDSGNAYADPLREVTPLYTAPPAPVSVPDERYQQLSELYHAHEKRLFKLAQRIKGPSFDKYAHSPSQAIDVLESAIFGESAEKDSRSAMLQGADRPQNEPQNIPENIPATQFKPVADLYGLTSPTGGETSFTFDAVEARDFIDGGWSCQDYVELERFQEAVSGNSPVIPDGWVILPAEPTQAMMNAWLSEVANWRGHAAGYRAMIAAAPQQE